MKNNFPFAGQFYETPYKPDHKQGKLVVLGNGCLSYENNPKVDLHELITGNRSYIDLMPVHTNIMRPSGLMHGSIAVLDKSREPRPGLLVAVRFNGDIIFRKLEKINGRWCLKADDPRVHPLFITEADTVERLGVITWCLTPIG